MSSNDPEKLVNDHLDIKHSAAALELGCPNFPNVFAIGASLKLFKKIGYEKIKGRILELNEYLCDQLNKNGIKTVYNFDNKNKSGITIIDVPNEKDVKNALKEKNIIVSTRNGGLRVSPHIYNNHEDIDLLVSAIKQELS